MPAPRAAAAVCVAVAMGLTSACSGTAVAGGAGAPVTGSVWVADEGSDTVSVLDAATGVLRATLTGLPSPHNVQASADGSTVWAVSGAGLLVALESDGSLRDSTGTDPHPAHVVAGPHGGVLVTASDGESLTSYDEALAPVRRTELPGGPHGVRTDATGRTAVVANTGAGTVDVVDVASGRVDARVPVGASPVQVAVSPDGERAYASVASTAEVVAVDLRRGVVVARRTLLAAPAQVLLTPAGDLLTADQGTEDRPGSTVTVLDPDTLEVRGRVRVGAGPHGLTSDPAGRVAWVSNAYDDTVSTIDLRSRRVLRTVDVGAAPNGVSYSPLAAPGVARDLGLTAGGASGHDHGGAGEHDDAGAPGHDHGAGEDHGWWPED